MTNNENYRPFEDYKEAFENSNRIVKHKSLIETSDICASFYISKTKRYVEFLIHVLCPVDSLWGIYLNLKTKTNAGSYIWITISPEDFLEYFIFYDTKEPCGVIEQKDIEEDIETESGTTFEPIDIEKLERTYKYHEMQHKKTSNMITKHILLLEREKTKED